MILLGVFFIAASSVPALAQDKAIPELPDPIKTLVAEGAQVRYLGQVNGLDGWVTIRQGQEQYFYVTPDKKNFVMGVLFSSDGRMLTIDQVQALRQSEGKVLDMLTEDQLPNRPRLNEVASADSTGNAGKTFKVDSPSQKLYNDMGQSNWVALGKTDAPYIYVVVDPQCPHCHAFLKDLRKDYIEAGKLQVRLVPIGLRDETRAQAAYLLAAPNPQEIWFRHLDGDKSALPATGGINQQGVQHNLAVVQNWKVDVTPFTVYKNKSGEVKIIRGRAEKAQAILDDVSGG